jgi:polyphosphate kinase
MSDEVSSWHLSGDGTWTRHRTDANGKDLLELQSTLIENSSKRRAKARRTAISARH